MLTYSQLMIVTVCTVGFVLFGFINYYAIRRLQQLQHRVRPVLALAPVAPEERASKRRPLPILAREKELALFQYHRDQVRRIVDARIELLRETKRTEQALTLAHAETAAMIGADGQIGAAEPGKAETGHASEPGGSREAGRACATGRRVLAPSVIDRHFAGIVERKAMVRREAERQLAEIETQMRALPGPSLYAWVETQKELAR